MSDRPRLSVAIPTKDTRDLVLRCLESLRRGGVDDLDVVVVDDGGTDGTAEAIAGRFPETRVLRNAEPRGFSAAANRALEASAGEVVLLLNSDTEVAPGALGILLDALDRRPTLGIAGADLRYPDGRHQWSAGPEPTRWWLFALATGLPPLLRRVPGYLALRRSVARNGGEETAGREVVWVTGAAMAIRRRVLEEVGRLDEGFRVYAQDLDYCLRSRDAGWEVWLVPTFEVLHHHGTTIGAGRAGGEMGRQPPALLWRDLIRLVEKREGRRAARAAAAALWWGASLRLATRSLAAPFVRRRYAAETWRQQTRMLKDARAACRWREFGSSRL